jgi:hypothetical protein
MLSPPLLGVRADSELAFASMLGLSPAAARPDAHPLRAGVLLGLVLTMVLVLAMVGLDAVL